MNPSGLLDALPILLLIVVGVLVRETRLVSRSEGLVLTRVVYYVTIPAAIIVSVSQVELTPGKLWLPVISTVIPCILAGIMYLTTRSLADQPEIRGVLIVGMVALVVFAYPFFELLYGIEGLANIALYDVGNAIYAGPIGLTLAQHFGREAKLKAGLPVGEESGRVWLRLAKSPLLWAAALGIALSLLGIELDGVVGDTLQRLSKANTPLAMISVGIFLRPRLGHLKLVGQFISLRMILGGILGWVLGSLVGLQGLDMVTSIVGSSLPAGTTALIYAGNEGLDTEFAASMISITVLVGAVTINLLPQLVSAIYM